MSEHSNVLNDSAWVDTCVDTCYLEFVLNVADKCRR